MTDLYCQMWQHMNGRERASLVKKFFFTVVLTKSDCLDWLDDKDYEEMQKFTYMVYSEIEYTIMLGCHCFYYSKSDTHGKRFCGHSLKLASIFPMVGSP